MGIQRPLSTETQVASHDGAREINSATRRPTASNTRHATVPNSRTLAAGLPDVDDVLAGFREPPGKGTPGTVAALDCLDLVRLRLGAGP